MSNKNKTEELKFIYSYYTDLLKFSETKNGALLVLNSGVLVALLSSISTLYLKETKFIFIIVLILLVFSIILNIISQFPSTSKTLFNHNTITNPNLYYYKDVSNTSKEAFVSELVKQDNSIVISNLDESIIEQIITISRITHQKLTLFKFSVYLTLFNLAWLIVLFFVKC